MKNRVAFDIDVFRRFARALRGDSGNAPDAESVAAVRIYNYLTTPVITQTVWAEIEEQSDGADIAARSSHVEAVSTIDDFYRGCVKGMSQRYVDYHSDPRDCRVAAEAECARVGALLTLNAEMTRALAGRVEIITITSPIEYWIRAKVPRGTPPRVHPEPDQLLHVHAWWLW